MVSFANDDDDTSCTEPFHGFVEKKLMKFLIKPGKYNSTYFSINGVMTEIMVVSRIHNPGLSDIFL